MASSSPSARAFDAAPVLASEAPVDPGALRRYLALSARWLREPATVRALVSAARAGADAGLALDEYKCQMLEHCGIERACGLAALRAMAAARTAARPGRALDPPPAPRAPLSAADAELFAVSASAERAALSAASHAGGAASPPRAPSASAVPSLDLERLRRGSRASAAPSPRLSTRVGVPPPPPGYTPRPGAAAGASRPPLPGAGAAGVPSAGAPAPAGASAAPIVGQARTGRPLRPGLARTRLRPGWVPAPDASAASRAATVRALPPAPPTPRSPLQPPRSLILTPRSVVARRDGPPRA